MAMNFHLGQQQLDEVPAPKGPVKMREAKERMVLKMAWDFFLLLAMAFKALHDWLLT